jgi:hypothetical protein
MVERLPDALKPPTPAHVLWDVVPEPKLYPLRGQILCWLFWRCWLNPFTWLLRAFFGRLNPYRRLVAVHAMDPEQLYAAQIERAVRDAERTPEGVAEDRGGRSEGQ